MTESDAAPASTLTAVAPGSCSVCPHPWADHDALGVRYCSATMVSAKTRGCICRPVSSARALVDGAVGDGGRACLQPDGADS